MFGHDIAEVDILLVMTYGLCTKKTQSFCTLCRQMIKNKLLDLGVCVM